MLVEKPSGADKGSAVDLAHETNPNERVYADLLASLRRNPQNFSVDFLKNFEKSVDRIKNNFYI